MHYSQGFLLMGCIVSFMFIHLAGHECNRLGSIALALGQDCSHSKVRGIGGDCERECGVRYAEYWGCCHAVFQLFKGFLSGGCPVEGCILVGEVSEGSSNLGVVL